MSIVIGGTGLTLTNVLDSETSNAVERGGETPETKSQTAGAVTPARALGRGQPKGRSFTERKSILIGIKEDSFAL
jgi:hypothetical protein